MSEAVQTSKRQLHPSLWLGLVLLVAGPLAWWLWPVRSPDDTATATPSAADPRIDALVDETGQLRRQIEDLAGVNRSLREQVLSLTRRVGLLEDLSRATPIDTPMATARLATDQAAFLLGVGETRVEEGDLAGALRVFDLADQQLARVADPAVVLVRGQLALEREQLRRLSPPPTESLLARLRALEASVGALSARRVEPEQEGRSRLMQLIDRYLVVRKRGSGGIRTSSSAAAARGRVLAELALARHALLTRDAAAFREALAFARQAIEVDFVGGDPATAVALAGLAELAEVDLRPALPGVGTAAAELRRHLARHAIDGAGTTPVSGRGGEAAGAPQEPAPPSRTEPAAPATEEEGVDPQAAGQAADEHESTPLPEAPPSGEDPSSP